MLSAFVLSLQWRYCLWEGLLWIQVEPYWKCSQDHSECQSADRQTEGALWTSGNYKLFFLMGVSYVGCLVPTLVRGKYGDRISFSGLKVRTGTVPTAQTSVELQLPVSGGRVIILFPLNQSNTSLTSTPFVSLAWCLPSGWGRKRSDGICLCFSHLFALDTCSGMVCGTWHLRH